MARMNHSRPELRYKDGLDKMRRQFVAAAKRLEAPAAAKAAVRRASGQDLSAEHIKVIGTMLDALNDYFEAFSTFSDGFITGKSKLKNTQKVKAAEQAMTTSIRAFLVMCVQDGLNNNGKMSAGLSAFNTTLNKALRDMPLIASVFTDEVTHMHERLDVALAVSATKKPKLNV